MSGIYISSSCVKEKFIGQSVKQLAILGYKNIELSGGTQNYPEMVNELLELKAKYNLNYLCHNYFPPPKQAFVINLAALNEETEKSTIEHLQNAINLSSLLGATKFGFHAGFQIDIPLNEVGASISKQVLWESDKCLDKFCCNFDLLKKIKGNEIELYLENNVIASFNFKNFGNKNPFFLVDFKGYEELKARINFRPLLDVAHLKVSSATLGLNFLNELTNFFGETNYIHISDNDGLIDSNGPLKQNSDLFEQLSLFSLKDKTVTLEVYSSLQDLSSSYEAVQMLMK